MSLALTTCTGEVVMIASMSKNPKRAACVAVIFIVALLFLIVGLWWLTGPHVANEPNRNEAGLYLTVAMVVVEILCMAFFCTDGIPGEQRRYQYFAGKVAACCTRTCTEWSQQCTDCMKERRRDCKNCKRNCNNSCCPDDDEDEDALVNKSSDSDDDLQAQTRADRRKLLSRQETLNKRRREDMTAVGYAATSAVMPGQRKVQTSPDVLSGLLESAAPPSASAATAAPDPSVAAPLPAPGGVYAALGRGRGASAAAVSTTAGTTTSPSKSGPAPASAAFSMPPHAPSIVVIPPAFDTVDISSSGNTAKKQTGSPPTISPRASSTTAAVHSGSHVVVVPSDNNHNNNNNHNNTKKKPNVVDDELADFL